ncbi:MAG: hypothetical protein QOC83_3965, partial [Pseudonocardiales bacterium]|nr:hypothetical protein [Pseudonocardiales bacterium]
YPPIDASAYLEVDESELDAALARRGLDRDGYVLFLSRVTKAKGIHDLVAAYAASRARDRVKLVIAGTGPALSDVRKLAAGLGYMGDRVVFLDDVDDDEKPLLMRGCATYALPTKPEPDFVETFGIALAEKMLAGGGPVITTLTGGTGEAVGDTAVIVEAGDVAALTAALDRVVLEMSEHERRSLERRGREYALAFDRARVFDDLFLPSLERHRRTATVTALRPHDEPAADTG